LDTFDAAFSFRHTLGNQPDELRSTPDARAADPGGIWIFYVSEQHP